MFFSPQTFNYSCPTSENRRKLKIQKLKRSTGTVACRKIKGISCSPSAGNTDTGTLSNRKGTWAKENRDLDWSGPEWHCHKWKRAKEEAEEQNGFAQSIEIHTRKLLGLGSFVSQHWNMETQVLIWRLAHMRGSWFRRSWYLQCSELSLRKASWGHPAQWPWAWLPCQNSPKLNSSKIKMAFLAFQSFKFFPFCLFFLF